MKNRFASLFLLTLLLALLLTGCSASGYPEGIVIGSNYLVEPGMTIEHDVLLIGGNLDVQSEGKVIGDVALLGGNARVSGSIGGTVTLFGGNIDVEETGKIDGDVVNFGGIVRTSSGSTITGSVGPGHWLKNLTLAASEPARKTSNALVDFLLDIAWKLFSSFGLAAVAVLAGLTVLRPLERVRSTITAVPFVSGLLGVFTLPVGVVVLVVLAITLVLIPLSLVGFLALGAAMLFGWIALGLLAGEKMEELFHVEWAPAVSAGVGTLTITLGANLIGLIPCVGWIIGFAGMCVGLGAVVFTRFGTQNYPKYEPPTVLGGQ